MTLRIALCVATTLVATSAAQAIVNQSVTTTPAFNGTPASNSDLLQMPGVVVTTTGYTAFSTFGQPNPVLTDGSVGGNTTANTDWPNLVLEGSADVPQFSVRYDLDLTSASGGYNITGIDSFAGWSDSRASQLFQVHLSFVDDPAFVQLNSGLGGPFGNNFGVSLSNVGSRLQITDSNGLIATGVDAIRFDFLGGGAGGHVIREIDVFGSPVVPEPASVALLALAGGALMFRRRTA